MIRDLLLFADNATPIAPTEEAMLLSLRSHSTTGELMAQQDVSSLIRWAKKEKRRQWEKKKNM